MAAKLFPLFLVVVCSLFGCLVGFYNGSGWLGIGIGLVCGLLTGYLCVRVLKRCLLMDPTRFVGGVGGLLAGALIAIVVSQPASHIVPNQELAGMVYGFLVLLGSLIGLNLGAAKLPEVRQDFLGRTVSNARVLGILDTSVIIDGRIADVCETGFLMGDLIIPEFILHELQTIADSSEAVKRTRGRRGLDILHKMQKQSYVGIIIDSTDYPATKEVDQKLINMARDTGYSILTNDFNLNKVAEVHSLQVLNMNQLANALKPVVLPGETIRVQVIKEGKEYGQGIAYLDDGTMVVVDAGRQHMGRTVEVVVTSVLQTTAGRMIFGTVKGHETNNKTS